MNNEDRIKAQKELQILQKTLVDAGTHAALISELLSTPIENTMPIICPTTASNLKRFVITSHNEGDTLANGDVITWVDNGVLTNPNDKVNVDVNGVDQGVSTQAGSWTLQNLPAGQIEICLQEMIFDSNNQFVGLGPDLCCYNYVVDQPVTGNLEKAYDIPTNAISPITDAVWNQMTNNSHRFASGNQNLMSVVQDGGDSWIQAIHPDNTTGTLSELCDLPRKEGADHYTVSHCILPAPNFMHGGTLTSNNSGKLGFGLGGGMRVTPPPGGATVSGGSTDTTGWTVRWGFDVINGVMVYIGYAYYANRPGMPSNSNNVFGHFINTGVPLVPGQKEVLTMEVIHNTPGNADGSIILDVSGSTTTLNNVLLMDDPVHTDFAIFGSWHGGTLSSVAPEETWVRYKDINIFCN